MVNTLTSQLVGIAKVPLYTWGNAPANANRTFDGASFGPVVANGISEAQNGNLAGVNFQRILPSGAILKAILNNFTGLGTSGAVRNWSYFDNAIWAASTFGGANGFPWAHTNYRFPLPVPVNNGTPAPIRGQLGTNINNVNNINVPFPAAAQSGDTCVISVAHGYAVTTPAGWTQLDNQAGSQINGATFTKVLTAGDIATGFVNVTFGGIYYGVAYTVVLAGTWNVKSSSFGRATFGGTPQAINSTASTSDQVLFFGFMRGPFTVQPMTQSITTNQIAVAANVNVQGIMATSTGAGNPVDTLLTGGGTTGGWGSYYGYVTIDGGAGPAVTLQNFPQIQLDTVFQTNKGNGTQFFPFMWQGRKAAAAWFNGQDPGASIDVWIPDTNTFLTHALDLSSIGFLAIYNVAMNRLIPGAAALSNVAQYDSVIVRWPGASGVGPAPIAPPSVTYINTLSGAMATQQIALDNAALNTMFQAAAQPVNPTIFPYGFIYPLPITTAGNKGPLTGQTREVLVFNTDLSQYYAIQFIPQDAGAAAAIAASGVDFFDWRWSVIIDEFGVVYYGSGASATLTTSFTPLNFFIPSIQAPPLNPFTLPCYNTCSPVDFL